MVDIVGDSSKFTKATDDAVKSGGKFSAQAIKGFGVGIGLGAFSLAAGAVTQFIGALGDADTAFKADQVSQAKMATALKNSVPGWDGSTTAIETYAAAQQKLGFQDDDIRDSIGQLIGITHDQNKAMELNSLAQDLARAKGLDLATATDIVTKAAQGNGKALKSLGIDTTGAKDAAALLADIHQNTLGAALDYSTTKQGLADAAAVKNSESWERIGSVVDKVSSTILPIAADLFSNLADVLFAVGDAIGPVVQDLVKELTPAFRTAMGFVTGTVIPVIRQVVTAVFPPLKTAVGILAEVFKVEWSIISTAVKITIDTISAIVKPVIPLFISIGSTLVGVATTIGTAVGNIIGFFTGVGGKIANATRGMWDGIFNAFRSVINAIIGGWNSLRFTLPSIDLGPLGKVGGFTVGTPNIPYLHAGGIVPGVPGSDVLTMLQAGEQVTRRSDVGRGGDVHIHFEGPVYGDGPFLDQLALALAQRLRVSLS